MKKVYIFVTALLLSSFSLQCSKEGSASQENNVAKGIPVQVMELKPRPFSEYLQITGTLEARNRIKIMAEEAGNLQKIVRDKGSVVRAGDTLAIIENKIIQASYNEAKAALNQSELDYSTKNVLYSKKAISENEYLAAKYGLERAKASYELNKARYSKLYITAPLNGYVNDRMNDLGAYVLPATPMFDFIDNATMKIIAGVAERFISDIRIGTPAIITFDAFPDTTIESTVVYVNKSIDEESRTFQIEIKIPNPERKLAPQMIANIRLLRRSYENQIVIPLDAVIESEDGRYVFVASPEKTARKVSLELLAIYEDSVLVQGLTADEDLIVVGQQELTEGDPLIIQN
jgi:membrane fusion protein (multidrug efflux system)